MREDIEMKPAMIAAGFKAFVKSIDVTNDNEIPGEALSFIRGNLYVWLCGDPSRGIMYWQTARLINNRFTGHEPYDSLVDVLSKFTIKKSERIANVIHSALNAICKEKQVTFELTLEDCGDIAHAVKDHLKQYAESVETLFNPDVDDDEQIHAVPLDKIE